MGCCFSQPTLEPEVNEYHFEPVVKVNIIPRTDKRFRLLIIGKTGSGKTTILSKVCGEDVADAPSTSRGHHDIEKEIVFQNNDKLVAHDSEGFEAGKIEEVAVVRNFIERRNKEEDLYQRLHMIWYCIEMNSRPIQQAEIDFFSVSWQVPVLAIITKCETFLQDVSQRLEEENEEGIDDAELEERAKQVVKEKFNMHYKDALMALPHPPKAVLALSEIHKSTPTDSRLTELIQETLKVLSVPTVEITSSMAKELTLLFATAQSADTSAKLEISVLRGYSDTFGTSEPSLSIQRQGMFDVWNISWFTSEQEEIKTFIQHLFKDIDTGPRIIGNPGSPCEQMIAETALIMEQAFLLKISNAARLAKLVKCYNDSPFPMYVRSELMKEHRRRRRSANFSSLIGMATPRLVEIVLGRPPGVVKLDF